MIKQQLMLQRGTIAKYGLPQPHTAYAKHRDQVSSKTKSIFSRPNSRDSTQRKLSAALFRTTSRTNNFFKPQSQQAFYRQKQQEREARAESPLRPFTESSAGRCHRAQSPLSVIRTRSKQLSNYSQAPFQPTMPRKSNFLRRGSSIDQLIIKNVLKSKFNQNICHPGFSYCDHERNKDLIAVISSQIPRGIKDVVGVEQMLRMSHVFTGTQFNNVNTTKRLKAALSQAKTHLNGEQEDTITLKSIKRW